MTPSRTEAPAASAPPALEAALEPVRDILRHRIWVPAVPPVPDAWPEALDARVVEQARALGIAAPWSPQRAAMDKLLAGSNVVLAAPTASGKSLVYLAVTLHHLLRDPAARVLYIAPTKALARDQLAAARPFMEPHLGPGVVAALDGDTPSGQRSALRERARLVLTNPEMLHRTVLPCHPAWSAWLGALRLVVVDELHAVRGVFGAHVAWVLRRLERLRRRYAAASQTRPPIFMASATIGNPRDHAARIAGRAVEPVSGQGAPVPGRLLALGAPGFKDRELGIRRALSEETVRVTRALRCAGLRTLVFARSRHGAEELVRVLRTQDPGDEKVPGVRVYRAGLQPGRRRAVEQGLRDGSLDVVVSTSALELGVDPGPLDACVLSGYPGTLASFWQQAGRAGRRDRPALVVWLAGPSALEQYLIGHPEQLLHRDSEEAWSDPENPLVTLEQLRCAAYEQPLTADELSPAFREALRRRNELRARGQTGYWVGPDQPAAALSLRRVSAATVRILCRDGADAAERELDRVERQDAPARIHPGALHRVDGRLYRVQELDLDGLLSRVTPATAEQEQRVTVPRGTTTVELHTVRESRDVPGATLRHGLLTVTHQVTGFREVKRDTGEVVVEADLDLPPTHLETAGLQVTLEAGVIHRLQQAGWWRSAPRSGARGPGWAAQRDRARERDGYRCAHCGAPEPAHRQHDVHHRRPFRTFGWTPGMNTAFREANRLENLVTLCPACHHRAETAQQTLGLLQRGVHVLRALAPLRLMCDPRDLSTHVLEPDARGEGAGWILLERTPGGVGFGEALYRDHEALMTRAAQRVSACDCARGCPACVGPPDPYLPEAREACAALFGLLGAGDGEGAP